MSRRNRTHSSYSPCSGRRAVALLALACALTWPSASRAQLDICGCAGAPGLGAFDTADSSSYPPGTTIDGYFITIQLPDDGVLIFDSLSVGLNSSGGWSGVRFAGNAANTPVTLLVKGDVTITSLSTLSVEGEPGTYGTAGGAGIGGLGGPGGFAGGDGAFQAVNLVSDGATGFGPGGGAGGIASPLANGADATFFGVPTLLPPVGGSGGGGGASSDSGVFCAGSGGGGGGGAILVAANGTITLDGTLNAWGGSAGGVPSATCASRGGAGGGGAVRLVANAIAGGGRIYANAGAIRLEAFTNTLEPSHTTPAASRSLAPGPLMNPLTPTVVFTAVNGETQSLANGELLSELPQGVFGVVDVILAAPGVATFDLATSGVPSGTIVEVTGKPRLGDMLVVASTLLDPGSCDGAGDCIAAVAFDLPAGAYVFEAQATFETP
ncbi:MAG: hypothetical protein JRG94_17785 [Deltaproteobacteria bacterium]|nr:hypothetical protein [Deltaproteobacteria bacterium]